MGYDYYSDYRHCCCFVIILYYYFLLTEARGMEGWNAVATGSVLESNAEGRGLVAVLSPQHHPPATLVLTLFVGIRSDLAILL